MNEIERHLAQFVLPRPDRSPIYEWAHKHIYLPESYATPGSFSIKTTPWLVGVFDALQNPKVRRVHFRKAVQTGGTLIADVWVPWVIVNDPGPISWTMQTEDMMEQHAKTRLNPVLERCKPVARMLPRVGPHRTTTDIFFGGFFLTMNAANLSSQQSQSIRYRVMDELFLPAWQEIYGHAVARVTKFEEIGRSKIYSASQAPAMDAETGNVEDRAFRQGHMAEWSATCPTCAKSFPLHFSQPMASGEKDAPRAGVVWDRDAKRDDETWDVARATETVRFRCPHCASEMPDTDATRETWRKSGHYVPTRLDAPPENLSFHVESLPTRSMRLLVEEFCEAENYGHRNGDTNARVEFRTKREAKPWIVERRVINLFTRGAGFKIADYAAGQKLPNEYGRYMMLDRQQDHWWAEVGAWTTDTGPRYRQLYFGRVESRAGLRQLQAKYNIPDPCVAQDRGFRPSDVDRDSAEFGWRALRGHGRKSWTARDDNTGLIVNFPFSEWRATQYQGHEVYYYEFSGDYFKDQLASAIEGKGDLKWELADDCNPLYLEHLRGEAKIEVRPGVFEWREVKSNAPNHGLDTSVMMLCVATIAGVVRFTPKD